MYVWSTKSVFAKCALQSSKILKKYINLTCSFNFQVSEPLVLETGFGPLSADFGSIWSDLSFFYKFGWVFYKFTEDGEFLNRWFLLLRGKNRDACAFYPIKLSRFAKKMEFVKNTNISKGGPLHSESNAYWLKKFKSKTLFLRVPGSQTSWILLNKIHHSLVSDFQKKWHSKPTQPQNI